MLRTFVVKEDMDLQALSHHLLDARFRGDQADFALDVLKRFNPHADLTKLTAGTLLLVPDTAGFKSSATTSVSTAVFDDFQKCVASALDEAADKLKSGNQTRAADRAGVSAFIKSAVFRRIVASDEQLKEQADEAAGAMAKEEERDKQAAESFDATIKSTIAALTQFAKIIR